MQGNLLVACIRTASVGTALQTCWMAGNHQLRCWGRRRSPVAAPPAGQQCPCWVQRGRRLPRRRRLPAAAGRRPCRRAPLLRAHGLCAAPLLGPQAAVAPATRRSCSGQHSCHPHRHTCLTISIKPRRRTWAGPGWAAEPSGRAAAGAGADVPRCWLDFVAVRYLGWPSEAAAAGAAAVAGACTAAGSFSHPAGLRERPVFGPGARVAGGTSLLPFTTCSSGLLPACLVASRLARHSARACCLSMVLMATSGQRIPSWGHGATC